MADEPQQFTIAVACPNCDGRGAAIWEESGDPARGLARRLISLQGAFHRETGRTGSGDPVIVCNACDEILPD
jgi:hypothetical protein